MDTLFGGRNEYGNYALMRINLHYPRNSVVVSRRLFTKRGQGCVGNCGVRWKKGNVGSKCGEPWNDIEFQSLLYQRPKVVTKPKEQSFKKRFSKSYVHAWVKKIFDFRAWRTWKRFLLNHYVRAKKIVTEKHLPTAFARFQSDIFHCEDGVREFRCGPRSHCMIQPLTIEKLQLCFAKIGFILEWQALIDWYNQHEAT